MKPEPKTHFGFREVEETEKAPLIRGVFDSVAPRYDLMNDLMSVGLHHFWKARLIDKISPSPHVKLLDVAGGTGDIAVGYYKKRSNFLSSSRTSEARSGIQEKEELDSGLRRNDNKLVTPISICDINPNMLNEGRNRAIDQAILNELEWICADAESLPFPDRSFDYYTIGFGIRNVTRISQALKEAYRALKPGGRFLCLEFSDVRQPLLKKLYHTYSFQVIPRVGQWVTGHEEAYRYLVESIERFPSSTTFAEMIAEAGFKNVTVERLMGGIVAIHSGWRV